MVKIIFKASKLYFKYVIKIISNSMKKLKRNSDTYNELEEKLYESYLKLEEIINTEFPNY